jgi:hypothetical protein
LLGATGHTAHKCQPDQQEDRGESLHDSSFENFESRPMVACPDQGPPRGRSGPRSVRTKPLAGHHGTRWRAAIFAQSPPGAAKKSACHPRRIQSGKIGVA